MTIPFQLPIISSQFSFKDQCNNEPNLLEIKSLPGLRPAVVANATMAELVSRNYFGGVGKNDCKLRNCVKQRGCYATFRCKLKIASGGDV